MFLLRAEFVCRLIICQTAKTANDIRNIDSNKSIEFISSIELFKYDGVRDSRETLKLPTDLMKINKYLFICC